jgi:NADPH-dependent 2,4-dienoyl-CoA reductase/sulfur reductase-like enzyme/rhodanese-related sulfurtransferase
MQKRKTIIIVGGPEGKPTAVACARRANENAHIILVDSEPNVSWIQPSLRERLEGDEALINQSIVGREHHFRKHFNVDIKTNTEALELDMDARCLAVQCLGKKSRLGFDSLIYTGSISSRPLGIDGLEGPRVAHFHDLTDLKKIRQALAENAQTAVVIGADHIALEAALGLKARGLHVTMVESRRRIMPMFSMAAAHVMKNELAKIGIEFFLAHAVMRVKDKTARGFILSLSNDVEIQADLVVVCSKITPKNSLLVNAGAAINVSGFLRVDNHLATSLPGVYACGRAVTAPTVFNNESVMQASVIERTAYVAATNAALGPGQARETLTPICSTLLVNIKGLSFARTGFNEDEAKQQLGEDDVLVCTAFGPIAQAKADAQMCVRLVVNRAKDVVVGGEVYGVKGVKRRIDLLAAAVFEGWSPQKIIDLDMAVDGGMNNIFDPLKEAAMRAQKATEQQSPPLSAATLASWFLNRRDFCLVDVGEKPLLSEATGVQTLHVPLETLRQEMAGLNQVMKPIVLFSEFGRRSYLAHQALLQRGLKDVYHLDGGLAAWDLIARAGG